MTLDTDNDFLRDKRAGRTFWLGPVIDTATIGEYQFLAYREKDFACGPSHGQETGRVCWSMYIDNKSIGRSAQSLDMALALVLSHKYLGPNSQAGELFMKMLAPEQED